MVHSKEKPGRSKPGPKKGQPQGAERKARVLYVQELMGRLWSDIEIRDELMERFNIQRSQAHEDIKSARDRAYSKESRERMQAGTVLTLRRVLSESFETTRKVTCPNCNEDGAIAASPRLDIALRTVEQVTKSFKLELTPEDLLGEEALAEKVAEYTIANLHVWSDDALERLDAQLRVIRQQRAAESGQ